MSVPSAEEQVAFLARVQRLLDEGVFVSTYKLALLMALLDLAVERGEDSGEPQRILLDAIAERVIGYYWRQVVPYAPAPGRGVPTVLAQNSGGPAAILAHVRQLRERCGGSLALARRDAPRWAATVREVRRVLRVMPLWKLQVVGGAPLEFLYPHRLTGEAIELLPGVAWNLRRFHGLVQGLVEAAWVRQVRRIRENQALLGETADLGEFLFGSERASLADYRALLREVQSGACFYCRRPLHAAGEVAVSALDAVEDRYAAPEPASRLYAIREVRQRLHQAMFRERVLAAYEERCALSGLPERHLVDAAHIVADADEALGQPDVRNGICLSKVHHAAFDAHLIGIDPDYRVHVSAQLLRLHDGPLLEQALNRIDGTTLRLPRHHEAWPDRERLAVRFSTFRTLAA